MFRRPPKRPERRFRPEALDRRTWARHAAELFNRGAYWEAHEALERIWRSVPDEAEARVIQGLIQAAAGLFHRQRGNRHGMQVVGEAALEKLGGPQLAAVEFDTERLYPELVAAFRSGGGAPTLRLRDEG